MKKYLSGYERADMILQGFHTGFSLGIEETELIRTKARGKTTYRPELLEKILEEVEKGFMLGPFLPPLSGPPPFPH